MKENKRSLTPRQAKLVKELSKGKTIGQAAIAAGYSPNNPDQSGHQALEQIKHTMPEILDSHGFTDEVLIKKYLAPGLNAKETEFAKFEGKITDERDVIAWGPRRDFLDIAFRLKGSYAPSQSAKVNVVAGDNSEIIVRIEHVGAA